MVNSASHPMASIIIVEDFPPALKLLTSICQEQGHEVMSFDNISAGIAAIREFQPEVALVDRRLGGDDGLELVRLARVESPDTRCVMVSACDDTRDIVQAMRRGAFNYVTKPFEPEEIEAAIQEALAQPQSGHPGRTKLVIVYPKNSAA